MSKEQMTESYDSVILIFTRAIVSSSKLYVIFTPIWRKKESDLCEK